MYVNMDTHPKDKSAKILFERSEQNPKLPLLRVKPWSGSKDQY